MASLILGACRDVLIYLAGSDATPCSTSTACVELGIAYCQKCLVGLHTETRAAFIGGRLNPMVCVPLDYIVDDEETLLRLLAGQGTE